MKQSRRFWQWTSLLIVIALLPACAGLEGDEGVSVSPVDPADAVVDPATPTSAEQVNPTTTPPGWLAELVSSGSTSDPPERVFLLDGPNVRLVESDLTVEQITEGVRVRIVSGSPDGAQAAVVYLTDVGSRAAEEIRLLDAEGELSEPIFGPEIVSGPAANPRMSGLSWSPDGSRLAVARDDGSLWIVTSDGASEPRQILVTGEVSDVVWSANGAAIAVLARDSTGSPGRIQILQVDGAEQSTIEPLHSIGALEWLMSSGRLIFVEEWTGPVNPFAGSIFAMEPGGSKPELLVSAGEFAPRVDIPMLSCSPDGRWLAFPVFAPGAGGDLRFLSLWLFELESGLLRQVEVPGTYQISDLWWSRAGLIWRGIQSGDSRSYAGVEPYVLGVFDLAEGGSRVIYNSDGS